MGLHKKLENDWGFGTQISKQKDRLLNQDGTFNVTRKGLSFFEQFSLFHVMINIKSLPFLGIVLIIYFFVNLIFASVYYLIGINELGITITNDTFHNFSEAFFFSTQTFTTVGYGRVSPHGYIANIVASIESLIGLMAFALATGLVYGRFSRPKANLLFSNCSVIAPYQNNGKALMFRVANRLDNLLIDLDAQVMLTYKDAKKEGLKQRFVGLNLERSKIYFLPTMWTIVHPIDEQSALYNWTESDYIDNQIELLVVIKAYDENFSQTIHTRFSYTYKEIIFNAKFIVSQEFDNQGKAFVLLDKISAFEKLSNP
jgi:inward rectifier potassium channel